MSAAIKSAIDRVPAEARNRHQLAALLEVTEAALAEVAKDDRHLEHYRRVYHCAALLWLLECSPPNTPAFYKVRAELTRTADAARAHAKRHGLPSAWGELMREARLVLDAVS